MNASKEIVHVPPGEGRRSVRVFGELVTFKVTGDETSGAYSLFEICTPPSSGPPPHVQHREDEVVYVLEGEYEFLAEDRVSRAQAGTLVYVPRGCLHAHTNAGVKPGALLVCLTPGGSHERYFEEVGKRATPPEPPVPSPDLGRIAEIAARYGIEIPLPEAKRGEKEPV
ncbi:MAG TPA: cupin domain-containing protein [Rubrobacter sp.]|nr:cupin domain-containing protein [Rubrobacter sp.]